MDTNRAAGLHRTTTVTLGLAAASVAAVIAVGVVAAHSSAAATPSDGSTSTSDSTSTTNSPATGPTLSNSDNSGVATSGGS